MKNLLISCLLFVNISLFGQSVDGSFKTLTATGTDTYVISEPVPLSYDAKERFLVRFTNANTGASTLNRATLGAKAIQKAGAVALSSGDIVAGGTYLLSYNGTYYQIVGDGGGGGGGPAWLLASGGTLTGANILTTTGANNITINQTDLGAGNGLVINSSSTDAGSNTQTAFRVNQTGANSNASQTTYSGFFSNTKTGTSSTNIGGLFQASGGTTNLAIRTGAGSVFIANSSADTPTASTRLDVRGVDDSSGDIIRLANLSNTPRLRVNGTGNMTLGGSFPNTDQFTVVRSTASIAENNFGIVIRSSDTGTPTELAMGTLATSSVIQSFQAGASFTNRPLLLNPSGGSVLIGSTTENARLYVNQVALGSAWIPTLRVDPGPHTLRTAATAFPNQIFSSATQSWAATAGTIASQKDTEFRAITHSAATSGTFTDLFNVYFENPLVGGAATATNSYAAGFEGNVRIGGGATASQLRFLEPSGSGSNYTAFQAVAQGADITYSLPPTVGAAGTVLTDVAGNGVLTWVAGGGGISNTAANNELMMSNGTDAVPSGIFVPSSGDINLGGAGLAGSVRTISANGSATDVNINLVPKGSGNALITVSGGQLDLINTGVIRSIKTNGTTNSVESALTLFKSTAGTPAVGIGAALNFDVLTGTGPSNIETGAIIEAVTTDVTSTSEDFDLVFKTMSGGAAAAERLRISSNGLLVANSNIGGGGTTNFLRADGTWAAPTGSAYYAPNTLFVQTVDANLSESVNQIYHLPDGIITTNRTITIPTGADGDVIEILNNEDTYTWTFVGATIYLADRTTTVTTLLYNVPTLMRKINGLWIITN